MKHQMKMEIILGCLKQKQTLKIAQSWNTVAQRVQIIATKKMMHVWDVQNVQDIHAICAHRLCAHKIPGSMSSPPVVHSQMDHEN